MNHTPNKLRIAIDHDVIEPILILIIHINVYFREDCFKH